MSAEPPRLRRRLALVGALGMLASAVEREAPAEYEVLPLDLPHFDITDPSRVSQALGDLKPTVIVNCAAYTDVDGCESREELATAVNGIGVGNLARAAAREGATLVHISTDYVFDGRMGRPYVEEDAPAPLSAYGRSKLRGERELLASGLERFFLVRTSWLYGPRGKNFVETIARLANERDELRVVADQVGCPTYTGDLARGLFTLLGLEDRRTGPYGIYHFSNEGSCSWHGFAAEIVAQLRARGHTPRVEKVTPIPTEQYPLPAKRPGYSILSKAKYKAVTGAAIPEWQTSLSRYLAERTA